MMNPDMALLNFPMALWSKREKNRKNSHLIIDFPTSEGVGKVSKQAVQSKQMSEQCEGTIKRSSSWPSTYVWILDYSGLQWMANF